MGFWSTLGSIGSRLLGVGTQAGAAALSYKGVQDTNRENARQARLNREFQERMSSTSWQRGVKDMEAAGLNPALAYGQGGASTPGGSLAAPMQSEEGAAVNSARSMDVHKATMSNLRAEGRRINEEAGRLDAETDRIRSESNMLYGYYDHRQNRRHVGLRELAARRAELENEALELGLPYMRNSAKAEMRLGPRLSVLERLMRTGQMMPIGFSRTGSGFSSLKVGR